MSLELYRVDERLLHGQVVVGWGERLGVDYYVVVDEDLADSPWEQELYESSVPPGVEVEFLAPDAPGDDLRRLRERAGVGCLLTRGTSAMRRLADRGILEGETVNVGGLHGSDERDLAVTDYVHLSPGEREDLRVISARCSGIQARDLPDSRPVPLDDRLSGGGGAGRGG